MLESEVMLTTESSIKHLTKLQDDLLAKIKSYRDSLLEPQAASSGSAPSSSTSIGLSEMIPNELQIWSEEFELFKKKWTDYFDQIKVCFDDEMIREAQTISDGYVQKLADFEKDTSNRAFNNKFMVFQENQGFMLSTGHIGSLETPNKVEPAVLTNFGIQGKERILFNRPRSLLGLLKLLSFFSLADSAPLTGHIGELETPIVKVAAQGKQQVVFH